MIIGKVIGNVWATSKSKGLEGMKLMVVEPYGYDGHPKQYPIVAADSIGAGIGETVLVVSGSSARCVAENKDIPVDSMIVGIIDAIDLQQ